MAKVVSARDFEAVQQELEHYKRKAEEYAKRLIKLGDKKLIKKKS